MKGCLFLLLWGAACLLLLGGCTGVVPRTESLDRSGVARVRSLFDRLVNSSCGERLDADLTMSWEGYGRSVHLSASLQAARPGFLRLSANDPLGRPYLLLALDGNEFVFLDIAASRGYTGPVSAAFVRRYLPASLAVDELTGWLTGTVDAGLQIDSIGRELDQARYWLEGVNRAGQRQLFCLDGAGRILRRLLMDRDGGVAVEALYGDYQESSGCRRPTLLEFRGQEIQGTIRCRFHRYYPPGAWSSDLFHPPVPPGFRIQEVR